MITSAAVSLSGVMFAGRIAYKLTDEPPERRWAGWAAGIFAGLALLGIQDYFHYILSSQSDPMIVALCLAAIDLHLDGRTRLAFAAGALAGLGPPGGVAVPRPLPAVGLGAPSATRPVLIGGVVVMALLWFGIPALTSRTPFVAAANAMDSGRRLTSDQVGGTIRRFLELHYWPLEIAALLERGAGRLATELGGPRDAGDGRRRGRLGDRGDRLRAARLARPGPLHVRGRGRDDRARRRVRRAGARRPARLGVAGPAAAAVGAVAVGLLVIGLIPPAISAARAEHKDLHTQRARTDRARQAQLRDRPARRRGAAARLRRAADAPGVPDRAGLHAAVNVSKIGFKYGKAIAHGNPIVMFTPTSGGWLVVADHQVSASCRSLPH